MEIVGKIKVINETQTFDSGFQKREIVVTTEETYPQDIKLEFTKDKCSILDQYKVGQDVKVSFNLRGNEYNDKYYVNLQAWRIEEGTGIGQPFQAEPAAVTMPEEVEGDLPF